MRNYWLGWRNCFLFCLLFGQANSTIWEVKLEFLSKIWWILFCVIIMNNTCLISAYCWYWICNGQYLLDSLKTSTDWSILCQIHPTVSLTHKKISPAFNFLMELKLDCSVLISPFAFFFAFVFFHSFHGYSLHLYV